MNRSIVTVPVDLDGVRADKVVAVLLHLSRSDARSIIDDGAANADGRAVKASEHLIAGTVLVVDVPVEEVSLQPDASVPFSVLYEDSALIVVDKPVGVVVHPGSGRAVGTLANGLLARYPEIEGVGQEDRWGIVHRLDRDTSGLLVVARTAEAHATLTSMLKMHTIERRYLTLVQGLFTNTTGTIDAAIGRDPANRTRMRVTKQGREAKSHYRRLAAWHQREASLLSVRLETGRTHQIRVHMRAIDHPIIGDGAYGRSGVVGDPGRPWLHARQLTFDHPLQASRVDVVSPLPQDLSDSLEELGGPDVGDLVDTDGVHL